MPERPIPEEVATELSNYVATASSYATRRRPRMRMTYAAPPDAALGSGGGLRGRCERVFDRLSLFVDARGSGAYNT